MNTWNKSYQYDAQVIALEYKVHYETIIKMVAKKDVVIIAGSNNYGRITTVDNYRGS